jgi:signal transduction histidine kinase
MKIPAKLWSGFGLVIALLAALATCQGIAIHRLTRAAGSSSGMDSRLALGGLDLMRANARLERALQQRPALNESADGTSLKVMADEFGLAIAAMDRLARTPAEEVELRRLNQFWRGFVDDMRGGGDGPPSADLTAKLQEDLERIRAQTTTVYEVAADALRAQARQAGSIGRRAELISWSSSAFALILSVLVAFLVIRSNSQPLAHLLEGTDAFASGKYYYRLDTSRKDELSRLARNFNTLTDRFAELEQMKKSFVSHVSHELKAPMASMREISQLLLEGIPGPLTDKQRRLLELNLQSGQRLSSMLSNLLDLSKIEAGVMEYDIQTHDVIPIVQTAVSGLTDQAREKSVTIATEMPQQPLPVYCDKDRLIQVIGNVLTNSLKFSPAAETVHVAAAAASEVPPGMPPAWRKNLRDMVSSGFVLISISDAGPGVDDTQKERVFEKFVQVRQGKRVPGQGLGLGLAISRTIIEAHGGAIWLADRSGGGSIVQILLRAA